MSISIEHQAQLSKYTACDIADTLHRLQIPNAGYIPDLNLVTSSWTRRLGKSPIIIAPASTLLFRPKLLRRQDEFQYLQDGNIPDGKHWVDLTPSGSILVMHQPESQKCAVLGGIMALRMEMLGVSGAVVCGRVRDLSELAMRSLTIWAKGSSIIGSAAEAVAYAIQITLDINGTIVKPGDVVFIDHVNGVVIIPRERLEEALALLPVLTQADEHITNDVRRGVSVFDAVTRFRTGNDAKEMEK